MLQYYTMFSKMATANFEKAGGERHKIHERKQYY